MKRPERSMSEEKSLDSSFKRLYSINKLHKVTSSESVFMS